MRKEKSRFCQKKFNRKKSYEKSLIADKIERKYSKNKKEKSEADKEEGATAKQGGQKMSAEIYKK